MDTAMTGQGLMFRVRNFMFFAAVLLMFYTLQKPSPVDMAFVAALGLSPFVNQRVTHNFLLLMLLLTAWTLSFIFASLPWIGEQDIPFELLQKIFVALLALTACFAAMSWRRQHFMTFMKLYVAACAITAVLGIAGFVTKLELLSWDGRAKGLINDPNMYAAFLVPGVLICLYMLREGRHRALWLAGAGLLTVGLLLSFSRAGIGALVVCGGLYIAYVNRRRPARLVLIALVSAMGLVLLLALLLAFGGEDFQKILLDRLTVAKAYDLGREGRYARYLRALPIILENPRGLGVLQVDKIFVEPIHNIWIGAFLSYGWAAGFSWVAMFFLAAAATIRNQRLTSDPLPILLFLCFLSAVLGATLHEGENWRPLWLFLGLCWGCSVDSERAENSRVQALRPATAS